MKHKIAMTLKKNIDKFHHFHILDTLFQIVETFELPGIYVLDLLRVLSGTKTHRFTFAEHSMAIPTCTCTCMSMPERPLRYLLKVCLSKQENVSEKKLGQDKYDKQGRETVLYMHTAEKF